MKSVSEKEFYLENIRKYLEDSCKEHVLDINVDKRLNTALDIACLIQMNKEIKKDYKNVYKYYSALLDRVIDLGESLNLKDSLDYCYLYRFLLYQGLFSLNSKESEYSKQYLVYEIMVDRGSNIHYSYMLGDLLKKLGAYAINLPNYLNTHNIINRIAFDLSLGCNDVNNSFCLINDGGFYYIFDPAHAKVFNHMSKDRYISSDRYYMSKVITDGCLKEVIRDFDDCEMLFSFLNGDITVEFIDSAITTRKYQDIYRKLYGNRTYLDSFIYDSEKEIVNIKRELKKNKYN